jgi:hypothetical protein
VLKKFSHDLMILGDSLAAMRVYDVSRLADALTDFPRIDSNQIRLFASGRQGIYAALAARINARIPSPILSDGSVCYSDWIKTRNYDCSDIASVVIPGMLRHLDPDE